ncbi:hypothetical protein AAFC00_007329 [Neodothiora populina]|uniref:FAD dependent oxidoreductase domain-containing protein n=1 Tax=Neodothiora populina TaxID=2781224 RepID=A0ABR3PHX2_9PEZI
MQEDKSVLIIGSGTFGTSTAYHLALRDGSYKSIKAIDKNPLPSIDSAAYDLNKIIRTEYDEPLYASLALEALREWRSSPLWKGIFHETGWIVTTCGDPAAVEHLRKSYENLKKEGQVEGNVEFVEGKDEIVKFVPQLSNAKGLQTWKGLWNRQAGWAHAKNALTKMGTEAQKLGVEFVSGPGGTMTRLRTEGDRVVGVEVASGEVLTANRYILCTGAASPALLPELSKELWSKCWTLGHIELTEEEAKQFKGMPIVDNHELGFMFEPDEENRWIKICNAFPGYQYRKGEFTDEKGRTSKYSIPRYASDHPEETIPEEAEKGIRTFLDAVLPQFSDRPLLEARTCWCTDSPDSHYLIDTHPAYPGGELLLATGDSGHAFKMIPIIGKYIADALDGKKKKEWSYGSRKDTGDPTRPGDKVKDLRDVGFDADALLEGKTQASEL